MGSYSLDFQLKVAAVVVAVFLGLPAITLGGIIFYLDSIVKIPIDESVTETPEYQPFLIGRKGFRGIYENIDTNTDYFAFPISLNRQAYFEEVGKAAQLAGWQLVDSEEFKQVYRRRYNIIDNIARYQEVELTYDLWSSEVRIVGHLTRP